MHILAMVLVGLVAVVHGYFLVLEMFLWRTPLGRRIFGTDEAFAERSAPLAANQGLYNGFLAAGLVWSLVADDPVDFQAAVFFLVCVIVAGVYGAATVSRRILLVQAVPGEKPPRWFTAASTGEPRCPSTAARTRSGTSVHSRRLPTASGRVSAQAASPMHSMVPTDHLPGNGISLRAISMRSRCPSILTYI